MDINAFVLTSTVSVEYNGDVDVADLTEMSTRKWCMCLQNTGTPNRTIAMNCEPY